MTRLLKPHEGRYAGLQKLLRGLATEIPQRASVWKALFDKGKWATESDLAKTLSYDNAPIVFVEDLPSIDGLFSPNRPATIAIARELIDRFEKAPTDPNLFRKVEATVLHETVHWSWCKAGEEEPSGREMGWEFESAAYPSVAPTRHVAKAFVLAAAATNDDDDLGALSRTYESNGKPAAIGFDRHGGWSYGLYQLSSNRGTLGSFIEFLRRQGTSIGSWGEFAKTLLAAGGEADAKRGSDSFKKAWRELCAADKDKNEFSKAQHAFIKSTHYDVYLAKLRAQSIDLSQRSKVVRDVVWSVSVQHGPGQTDVFTRPWKRLDAASRVDDARLIDAVYDERSRVGVYFSKSTADVQAAVAKRFARERAAALRRLST